MISPYHEIITSDNVDFEDFLVKKHLFGIFKCILEEFQDGELFKKIVRFIAYGYSINSELLNTTGNTWSKLSKYIYEYVDLPESEDVVDAVMNLRSDAVRLAIERWLQFQNDENFIQYVHYRDLRREFLTLSISDMKKSTGEIDVEAKMKAVIYAKDLLKMMEDAKDAFIQNHPKLKGSVEALNKASREKMSRSIGDYAVQ